MVRNQDEIKSKFHQINEIVALGGVTADSFKRGELAGAQQVLYWILEKGMEPVQAFLSDEELARLPRLSLFDEFLPEEEDKDE